MSDMKKRAEIFQGYVLTHMDNAKALVRDLAAEVERLEAELEKWTHAASVISKDHDKVNAENRSGVGGELPASRC